MSRLIDADALMEECQLAQKQAARHGREYANAFYSGSMDLSTEWWCVEDMIENAPTVEERKKGKWLMSSRSIGGVCSECGESCSAVELTEKGIRMLWKYCPNCGADMREAE